MPVLNSVSNKFANLNVHYDNTDNTVSQVVVSSPVNVSPRNNNFNLHNSKSINYNKNQDLIEINQ